MCPLLKRKYREQGFPEQPLQVGWGTGGWGGRGSEWVKYSCDLKVQYAPEDTLP